MASQVALHAPSGGIVPELAARAHLRWIVPMPRRGVGGRRVDWRDIDGIAVTYGPGLAGSLLVGINFAKALSWVHDVPLIGVNHLEGHVYAAWLLDPGEDEATRRSRSSRSSPLVVSGGHTFIAEMTDHLTYRLLGTTVDDAAGEAFDKVGRLLGLGYPGGPAIQKAAEGATRRDVRFPRAWMGDSYDLQLLGTQDRSPEDRGRRPRWRRASQPMTPRRRLSEATTAELAWGFQDSVVDVLATKTVRAAEDVRRPIDRAGRRRRRQSLPPRAPRRRGRRAAASR